MKGLYVQVLLFIEEDLPNILDSSSRLLGMWHITFLPESLLMGRMETALGWQ